MTKRYYEDRVGNHFAVEATITEAGTFTEPMVFDPRKKFNVSVNGAEFYGTIRFRRSFDNGGTWHDVWTTPVPVELIASTTEEDVQWIIGCDAEEYFSGTVFVRLGQ